MNTIENYKILNAQVKIFFYNFEKFYNVNHFFYGTYYPKKVKNILKKKQINFSKNINFIKKFEEKFSKIKEDNLSLKQKNTLNLSFNYIFYYANVLMNLIEDITMYYKYCDFSFKKGINELHKVTKNYIEVLRFYLKKDFPELFIVK